LKGAYSQPIWAGYVRLLLRYVINAPECIYSLVSGKFFGTRHLNNQGLEIRNTKLITIHRLSSLLDNQHFHDNHISGQI
jgi:hypothetical protein